VRIGREDWPNLHPEDVAWVTEWQLACAFRWVPIGTECGVTAAPAPGPSDQTWDVSIRLGPDTVSAQLPVRDLARLVCWCQEVRDVRSLLQPPAWVRASMLAVQRALRARLSALDPLGRMGYTDGSARDLDRGGPGR
jgi:hypothetical protein